VKIRHGEQYEVWMHFVRCLNAGASNQWRRRI
jgi:hypothetical protein